MRVPFNAFGFTAAAASALALAACAAGERPGSAREVRSGANLAKVIATELAFARTAREKGTWTAFREYATKDAVWPAPDFQNVQQSLKGVPDPAEPIMWGPDTAWSSCDGSFAVTTGGASYPSGRTSRFLTVWQRQRDGEYRWVLDQGFDGGEGYVATDTVASATGECRLAAFGEVPEVRRGEKWGSGHSNDATLVWETQLDAQCARTVTVWLRKGEDMEEVFRRTAPPPPVPDGQPAPSCTPTA